MSRVSRRLLDRLDFADIRRRRVENYRRLDTTARSERRRACFRTLPDGVCPLFFPIVVRDKHAAARDAAARGVDALEFWNDSCEPGDEMGPDARFLRAHVLELPIHQDLTPRHIAHVAEQVSEVDRLASDAVP